VVVERYFCLGDDADKHADHYLMHYYGEGYFAAVRADTLTTGHQLDRELHRLREAGADDVVLLPCVDGVGQVERLADALDALGIPGDETAGRALR
jgi:hypothetical protein